MLDKKFITLISSLFVILLLLSSSEVVLGTSTNHLEIEISDITSYYERSSYSSGNPAFLSSQETDAIGIVKESQEKYSIYINPLSNRNDEKWHFFFNCRIRNTSDSIIEFTPGDRIRLKLSVKGPKGDKDEKNLEILKIPDDSTVLLPHEAYEIKIKAFEELGLIEEYKISEKIGKWKMEMKEASLNTETGYEEGLIRVNPNEVTVEIKKNDPPSGFSQWISAAREWANGHPYIVGILISIFFFGLVLAIRSKLHHS